MKLSPFKNLGKMTLFSLISALGLLSHAEATATRVFYCKASGTTRGTSAARAAIPRGCQRQTIHDVPLLACRVQADESQNRCPDGYLPWINRQVQISAPGNSGRTGGGATLLDPSAPPAPASASGH